MAENALNFLLLVANNPCSYPVWHAVSLRLPMMEVEDHDGGDHAARHHEHDAVEVGPYQRTIRCYRYNL